MHSSSLYHSRLARGDYYPNITAWYFRQWDGYRMAFHAHESIEVMYVLEGSCAVETVDASHVMRKGDLILLDSYVNHRLIVEEACRMLNVEFGFHTSRTSLPSIRQMAEENQTIARLLTLDDEYLVLKDSNEIAQTLKSLVLELDGRAQDSGFMSQLLLTQLLVRIARLVSEKNGEQLTDVHVQRALAFMHHHYDCEIQVTDIAASVNLHPAYLHRLFKKHTGQTIMEYLTAFRVEKAKMLLTQTDIPIIEIAQCVGMNSRQYFTSVFKKLAGRPPAAFRKSVEKSFWNKG